MRRIVPIEIKFVYLNKPDSPKRLRVVFNRIFEIAKKNYIERRRWRLWYEPLIENHYEEAKLEARV